MKLSPLRKEVQSLNKELQSQNIQIKDLIGFLNKSTPKQKPLQVISPRNYLAKISLKKSQKKQKTNPIKYVNQDYEKKVTNKQNIERASTDKKQAQNLQNSIYKTQKKINGTKEIPMTKSVTFHNMQNALTTRRYLKLSRPQKKLNNSCTFCREPAASILSDPIKQSLDKKPHLKQQNIQNLKHQSSIQSLKKQFKSLQKIDSKQSNRSDSKSKKRIVEKKMPRTQKKNNALKQLESNQIFSKNQIKNFIEKKSLPFANSTKNKAKLSLKDEKTPISKTKIQKMSLFT